MRLLLSVLLFGLLAGCSWDNYVAQRQAEVIGFQQRIIASYERELRECRADQLRE